MVWSVGRQRDLDDLRPSQEQTHRNTLAAAEKAKQLPDATPAGKLNSAATKMEQAAVYLRKSSAVEPDEDAPPLRISSRS